MIPLQHPMASIDAAFLRMDRRTNPMVIVGVMVLATPCTLAQLRHLVAERFLKHERFRCVPVAETIGAAWVEDPLFELEAHVGEVALPGEGTQADLERLAGELASTALDPRRPLWRFDLVTRYGAGSAIIERFHHCYADGIAFVRLFLSVMTPAPGAAPLLEPITGHDLRGEDDALLPWLRPLLGSAGSWLGEALSGGTEWLEKGLHGLLHPLETLGDARTAAGMAGEIARLAQLSDDPPTPLRGALGTRKQTAWAAPVPLAEVRTVAHALGCTINDVLLSAVAGALGRYLSARGFPTEGVTLRGALPVNLRAPEDPATLGNRFGLVLLDLPVGVTHPLERLYALRSGMQRLKGSQQAGATFVLLSALGHLPAVAETLALDMLSAKASAVISNVPGPRESLYMCDQRVSEMYFWVPQSGTVGLGISVLSYAAQVHFGLIADRNLVPEPHVLVDGFGAEFERLLLLTVLGAAHCAAPSGAAPSRAGPRRAARPAPAAARDSRKRATARPPARRPRGAGADHLR